MVMAHTGQVHFGWSFKIALWLGIISRLNSSRFQLIDKINIKTIRLYLYIRSLIVLRFQSIYILFNLLLLISSQKSSCVNLTNVTYTSNRNRIINSNYYHYTKDTWTTLDASIQVIWLWCAFHCRRIVSR